jgi:heme/copper-type cytochrome/quinol oxidase subunit 2
MTLNRRTLGLILLGTGACLVAGSTSRLFAQDQAPNRREFSMTARDYRFAPDRLEVMQDDLVKVTITSADVTYAFTIDQYKISKRVPAGASTTIEFRADQVGTFDFYSGITSDERHSKMRGQLVVRRK